ncbi:MAG: flippase [bacterium]
MSVQRKVAVNAGLQMAGRMAATAIGLVTVAIMARYLGPEGYGGFTTVLTFLQIFATLAGFGLPITTSKLLAREGTDERRLMSNAFTLRLLSGLGIFALVPFVGLLFPYSPEIKLGIAVGTLSFLGLVLQELLVAVFQRHLVTWKVAIAEIAGRVVLLGGTVLAVTAGRGLISIIAALAAGNLIQFGLSWLMARRFSRIGLAFEMSVWKEILRESWPIGVSVAFNLIYLKGDVLLLTVMRTQAEVGLYGAAYKVLDVVTVLPYIFMGLVLPLLSAAWSRGDREDFNRKLSLSFDFLAMIALPIMFGAFAVSNGLMAFVAGRDFTAAGPLVAVLMVGGAAVFWHSLYGNALVALGGQKKMVVWYAVNAAVSVALYLLLIPRLGGLGAALVTAFSELFIAVAVTATVAPLTGFRPNLTQLGKTLLASAVMGGALFLLPNLHVALSIPLGVAIFVAVLAALRGLPLDSIRQIVLARPGHDRQAA